MKSLRKKTTATLLIAVFMVSMVAFAVAIPVEFPSEYDRYGADPESGTVEWTRDQAHRGSYSAYLRVTYPSNPPGEYGWSSDANGVYVLPIAEITTLDDLDSFSFYYYRPDGTVGGADIVPPQVDLWLDTNHDGVDTEWLLGQIDYADTYDVWVYVDLEDITWINAMGGEIYGTGSVGLDNAKNGVDGPAWGAADLLGFGIQLGSAATRDNERIEEGKYYIDDIKINDAVYDFEDGSAEGSLELEAAYPTISISLTDADIVFPEIILGGWDKSVAVGVTHTGNSEITQRITWQVQAGSDAVYDDMVYYSSVDPNVSFEIDEEGDNKEYFVTAYNVETDVYLSMSLGIGVEPGVYTGTIIFWAEYEGVAPE